MKAAALSVLLTDAVERKKFPRKKTKSKFSAIAVTVGGLRFDSKLESRRYATLETMARCGEISDLQFHTRFPLMVEGVKIGTYEADFTYTKNGASVIEDAKGVLTPMFRWKARHMAAQGSPVTIWPERKKVARRKPHKTSPTTVVEVFERGEK